MAQIKQPNIEDSSSFSFFTSIWIVPFVALIISLWLVYQHFSKLGPEIRILFQTSGGLEGGQSILKYRNVPVGKVSRIEIQEDGKGVVVVARMSREIENFMNETAKFWIVKPEVGYSGVSGLETLISGSYITLHATDGNESKQEFVGLSAPYRDINSGEYILLSSRSVGGIRVGTPINYRNIQVGEVEHMSLAPDGSSVEIVAFIQEEYSKLINITTKFWLQALADIGIHGNRLDIKLAPIIPYLAFGGITFESKFDKGYPKAESNYFYRLYNNQFDADNKKIGHELRENHLFSFSFKGKISGLKKGASIQYYGFDVGEVMDVSLSYNSTSHAMEGLVHGEIDLSIFAEDNKSGFVNLNQAVESGLRAQLLSVNPLISTLFIDLEFAENTASTTLIKNYERGTIFPVMDVQKSSLLDELTQFTNKLNQLELNELLASAQNLVNGSAQPLQSSLKALEGTITEFRGLVEPMKQMLSSITDVSNSLDGVVADESIKNMPEKLNKAIEELAKTLRTTKKILKGYRSNSLFGKRVTEMLKEINKNSEESKRLLRKLNKKPNSLILGD
ncbi:MAG: MCE family protein [Sulfurovum sp.]|nr:MCE family protein [Sulfurovum sp.]